MRTVISRADLARLLRAPALGNRGAEAALPAEAELRRVARLLRADRARHRLRRGQPADAGEEDRRRLGDQRREDVHLARQPRQGRADLRPDRPGARSTAGSPASWSTPISRASSRRRSTTRWACAAPTPPRSRSTTCTSPTTQMLGEIGDGFKVAMSVARLGPLQRRRRLRRDLPGVRRRVGQVLQGARAVRPPDRELPARPGDARRHEGRDRRGADARLARRLPQGRGQAEHDRDLDRQAVRHRGGGDAAPTPRSRSTAARATSTTIPVERYFRDVRVTTLYEGTTQIQQLIIGRALTGINALVPS